MSERLTVKEIKQDIREDEFRSFVGRLFEKIEENPSAVVGSVVGIVALVLAVVGVFAFLDSRKANANEQLGEALRIFKAPIVEDGADPQATAPSFATDDERRARAKEALAEVSSGDAAKVAQLLEADIALEEGDKETARKIWEDFLASNDDNLLSLSIRLNLIHLDRAEGRSAELANELQQELDGSQKSLPEDVLLYELARTREALGESDVALELYQRIVDEYPTSPYTAQARRMTTAAG